MGAEAVHTQIFSVYQEGSLSKRASCFGRVSGAAFTVPSNPAGPARNPGIKAAGSSFTTSQHFQSLRFCLSDGPQLYGKKGQIME